MLLSECLNTHESRKRQKNPSLRILYVMVSTVIASTYVCEKFLKTNRV